MRAKAEPWMISDFKAFVELQPFQLLGSQTAVSPSPLDLDCGTPCDSEFLSRSVARPITCGPSKFLFLAFFAMFVTFFHSIVTLMICKLLL
jgi:hypothetical protein